MRHKIILLFLALISSTNLFAQTADFVQNEGITSPLHRANIGKITFMSKLIPVAEYKETDFLNAFELKEKSDFNIRVFMDNSLTNYLHRLAPALGADELNKAGNYQFTFYVNGELVYRENLHPGAGLPENKKTKTVFRIPLMSATNEDSWGRFLWNRFMMRGGEEALTSGTHKLRIEIRPYLKTESLKVGDLIAEGQINLIVNKPKIDESRTQPQHIKPNSGFKISGDGYNKEKIKALNQRIAENVFKDITGIVVLKNGELLIEEYFNGANRDTLHDTRSVGKTFASAMAGIALNDGHLKSINQPLSEFYNLKNYENYNAKKETVTIKHLLTMSSGFDGFDFDETSVGNEENMYPQADWVKWTLNLPMAADRNPGEKWFYFTAGVVVLGDIVHKSVPEGLEKYAHRKLFEPLGINNYKWEYTPQKVANTAGGLRMSALDFARFGQLYKNGGKWKGSQIIPADWVNESFTKHQPLPESENEFYGYLFWNKTYKVNNRQYETFYCTGNGGNKIFIFKDVPLVIVVTATAYGKPYGHFQVDRIIERYVLPAVFK